MKMRNFGSQRIRRQHGRISVDASCARQTRRLFGLAAALLTAATPIATTLTVTALTSGPAHARADQCADLMPEICRRAEALRTPECQARLEAYRTCLSAPEDSLQAVPEAAPSRGLSGGSRAPAAVAPAIGAPAPASGSIAPPSSLAPAPRRAQRASPRTQAAVGPLAGRLFFLTPGQPEPEAVYYGYLAIGADVSEARKNAVAEAIACRLQALPDAEAAAAIERLGLFTIPADRDAGSAQVSPARVAASYDYGRARRWLRAAGFAVEQRFDPADAIVFIASPSPRARAMDSVALAGTADPEALVVADASALSARYAAAWVGQIIDSFEGGAVSTRQELQGVMETISWIDWAQEPLVNLFRVAPAEAANPPEICP